MHDKFGLSVLLFILVGSINARSIRHEDDLSHHNHTNEIGIANSAAYFLNHREVTYGLHIHYMYNLPKTKFGLGTGYERIFDEHGHNSIGIIFNYRPADPLNFNISPGISFEDNPGGLSFAGHFEILYEFFIGDLHLGPAIEFAHDKDDNHLSLGLHIGLGF